MDIFEALHTRRSIRKYTDRDVPDDLIDKILAAAMMAPSAGNQQPWQFIVITEATQKERMATVHPYVNMVRTAPIAILVCGDLTKEKFEGFWPQDCSAAMENLLLAAHGAGLGAVWTGIYPLNERIEKFREICLLPEHIIPLGLAILGWPDHNPAAEERFDPERIHFNTWSKCAFDAAD